MSHLTSSTPTTMVQVPVEIWYKISQYIDCPNPMHYTNLAAVCRSAYIVFTCDAVWKPISFEGSQRDCFQSFTYRVAQMTDDQQRLLQRSWAAVDELTGHNSDDPVRCLQASADGLYFKEMVNYACQNRDLLLPIVVWYGKNDASNRLVLENIPLVADRVFMKAAVSICGKCFALAPSLCDEYDIVLQAVSSHGEMLELASPRLKLNYNIVLAAVSNYGTALRFVDSSLAADRVIALQAVKSHGWALQRVATALHADKEIVLNAVKSYCGALQIASHSLRSDKAIVTAAVSQQGWTLQYATKELCDDIEVVSAAVNCSPDAIKYASLRLRDNDDLVSHVVARDGALLRYASPRLQKDPGLLALAQSKCAPLSCLSHAIYQKYANWIMEAWEDRVVV